eukprot:7989163-Alexandrium_andersonii.AAC.1
MCAARVGHTPTHPTCVSCAGGNATRPATLPYLMHRGPRPKVAVTMAMSMMALLDNTTQCKHNSTPNRPPTQSRWLSGRGQATT